MVSIFKNSIKFALIVLITSACNNPKVIKSTTDIPNAKKSSGIFSDDASNPEKMNTSSAFSAEMHSVKVNEVLKTSKYLYLNVTENDEQFWIATRIMDVIVGETYYYKGGLLKTNYESKDFNRVFKKIYLISSNLVASNHATNKTPSKSKVFSNTQTTNPTPVPVKATTKKIEVKGSMKISELLANKSKYEGKTVQISGVCVKSNPNIMSRNWMHLKDGSQDDFDLVFTSDTFVPEGKVVTIKATVTLNKDFGAGYKYELILENGTIIN
ncbi:MAG: hypothetical protein COC22_05375 [Flavobacteriaceae bacterium]|nr:MAG: hypothetical protein COC22_05375 [Flavobacteriaceae bacterium]